MEAEILSWVKLLVPTVLGLIIGWLGGKLRAHSDEVERIERKQDANNKGTCCLLRKAIIDMYELYVTREAPMTIERRHEITTLYEAYKELGGNGTVDHLYNELINQPTLIVNDKEPSNE